MSLYLLIIRKVIALVVEQVNGTYVAQALGLIYWLLQFELNELHLFFLEFFSEIVNFYLFFVCRLSVNLDFENFSKTLKNLFFQFIWCLFTHKCRQQTTLQNYAMAMFNHA